MTTIINVNGTDHKVYGGKDHRVTLGYVASSAQAGTSTSLSVLDQSLDLLADWQIQELDWRNNDIVEVYEVTYISYEEWSNAAQFCQTYRKEISRRKIDTKKAKFSKKNGWSFV